ncbi:kinase non-catalytic C-lobe domain-containing protein 1 [Puntigrus tetrazona]|uniref:kinase non-catalytic C-lobe domain-containing protein 1 n=1 Tax=Puntigrus tetrazona TaxID=1606681 RepID=UPI001C8A02F7|nr:kinase non-catalytic C-lobe domain-containing protein 1 [Puntigrus tetrazona]
MGTFRSAELCLDEEEEEEKKRREVERLPPLLEDEENVSLADVVCLRDGGRSEQELWAVCVECVRSLQSVALSPLFHTLCVTPDTLAFNAHGNVCFMEQLSDDPEGCFVPPELDKTGSTFEGHMFSLGSTLWAALDSVEAELSEESRCFLKQMQREKAEDRPGLQDVLSRAEAVLGDVSSASVCRKLSAIGRRVLSIESIAALQDGWERSDLQFMDHKAWRSNSTENPAGDRSMIRNYSADSYDGEDLLLRRRGQLCNGSPWSGGSDSRSQNSSPVHRRSQERRPGRAGRALNRSCSVPDSNNPPALSPPSHAPISTMMADLSDITEEESWSGRLRRPRAREDQDSTAEPDACETDQSQAVDTNQYKSNHFNKTVLCLNEESHNQWISLRELLSCSGQPFSVSELWALCYTCLSTLQTYIDLPDYLCLDSVYVGREGEMLFLRPKNSASCDAFFLAPEFQEHGIVTEKVCRCLVVVACSEEGDFECVSARLQACVYGVAAVLWATAKFHLSPGQKLAMPRKLKRLLLEMAKRTPIERPSIEMAKKACREYLSRQGTNAESVWTQIISRVHQALDGNRDTEESSSPESEPHLGEVQTGFVPLAGEGRLEPVAGPVPHHYPESSSSVRLLYKRPSSVYLTHISLTFSELFSVRGGSVEADEQDESGAEDDGTVYSSSSSHKTPATPQKTHQETDGQPPFPALSCSNGARNNFLLQQDPLTGSLTLLPVQIAVLQPITGPDHAAPADAGNESVFVSRRDCLQNIMELLREQGASDDSHQVQHLAMGEYIFSLETLRFETFCRAITEKFRALFWDEKLLRDLHRLINQGSCPRVSDDQSSSKAVESARQRPSSEENTALDHNANLWPSQLNEMKKEEEPNEFKDGAEKQNTEETRWRRDPQEVTSEDDSKELMDLLAPDGGAAEAPDRSEPDADDCDSVMSERTLSGCSGPRRAPGRSWALALYGDECFGPDVLEYTQKLSGHSQTPTLEDKSQDPHFIEPEFFQELHQQLIIESRNLKKTSMFYHKLIQQERKNKGSDTKAMASKVKLQFDELREKVEFLQSVQKYLQVLSVDQWGLALSLLPSLAVCGAVSLELQHSDDPALLHILCEQRRGKGCPLVTATARGFMAYLYARNAHIEGFIRQFFYTYRYFCTPEELLQFLMDTFNSTLGAGEDPSSDRAKVYQRTLDLLHFWIEDAQLVDFSSSLLQTLHAFLTTQVSPVDGRGESLLSALQSSPCRRHVCDPSCVFDPSISDRKLSVSSPAEDTAPKGFQPQTLPSKDKVFSIAAALPRPCYASLMSLRSDERRPFSQSEHTALSIGQQLTLLEQEIFQDCHPVHFLNSRAHGVTENSGNISRCVSPLSSPLEGSDASGPQGPLQRLLTHADCVSNWVSAEVVVCDSAKAQASLLARFLAVGKFCYETRNFSTAMQILSGLENVIVRQLPAWKHLSLKVCEVLEELRAVQVFLKSDSLCLMEGEKGRRRPTLPDAQILALHVQQLEIGAFTVTSGAYKWPKLRNIARVVSQVHAFQERLYSYPPDLELQSYLRGRIARSGRCDILLLASDNHINFSQTPAARRIHDTLRRVKASFQ